MNPCPKCGNELFKTERINFAWFDVFIALTISLIAFFCLFEMLKTFEFQGSGRGKLLVYLILGVVGLVGWIFSKKVKKEKLEIESCTRCDYKKTSRVEV